MSEKMLVTQAAIVNKKVPKINHPSTSFKNPSHPATTSL